MPLSRMAIVWLRRLVATILCALGLFGLACAQETEAWRAMNQPFPPFRMIGNLYYVGASDVTSFLVATPAGHILIDGGFVETVPLIEKSVAELGFDIRDVKILLNSHAHLDHAGGLARLKELTGAQLMASAGDAPLLEAGGRGDPILGDDGIFPVVHVDRRLTDGDNVELGGTTLTARVTAGHTPGCTSWAIEVTEGKERHLAVSICSLSILRGVRLTTEPTWPGIAQDFERSFATLRSLPCDVPLAAHGSFFDLAEKRKDQVAGASPNPFIDPAGYRAYIDRAEARYHELVAEERGAATTPTQSARPRRVVAVTFDDLPCNGAEGRTAERQLDINRRIVAGLVQAKIPAVGFVNEARLEGEHGVDPRRVAALELWLDAGLELGNHSYSHPSLHEVPLEAYLADIEQGERVTRELLAKRGLALRWFRHPYLQTGRTLETKHAVEQALAERKIRVAPVTFDNSEWIFARGYLEADDRSDAAAKSRLAEAYVAYMEAKVDYFERQSVALFSREIAQVLLVHANRLNADHFPEVAAMLAQRGYRFVTLEHALEDPAYASADTFTGAAGISWLHRWALSAGGREKLVPDEPPTPEWVRAAAGVESE